MCLLTTVGRRSGLARTVPLACFPRGDEVIVIASNNGQDRDPIWWVNLQANPEARVRLGRTEQRMCARCASPEQRAELWPWLKARNSFLDHHERRTTREIPVVILHPVDDVPGV